MTIVNDDGIRLLTINGVNLPVRSYRFDDHGAPLHVFYCYWNARSCYENAAAAAEEDWSARGRVRAAMRGRRELGAQMLEIVVWGMKMTRPRVKPCSNSSRKIDIFICPPIVRLAAWKLRSIPIPPVTNTRRKVFVGAI
ncbi:MAG: hypothetical protein ABJB69_05605 [Spartobacteria bacterium]